jgi:hypothetical protein
MPKLFDRSYCDHTKPPSGGDEAILRKADRQWRDLVARQEPVEHDPRFVERVERVVAAARKELLAG